MGFLIFHGSLIDLLFPSGRKPEALPLCSVRRCTRPSLAAQHAQVPVRTHRIGDTASFTHTICGSSTHRDTQDDSKTGDALGMDRWWELALLEVPYSHHLQRISSARVRWRARGRTVITVLAYDLELSTFRTEMYLGVARYFVALFQLPAAPECCP